MESPETDTRVIIAAHNEALILGRCIESVLNAGIRPGSIYVIDDGSKDATAVIAASFGVRVLVNIENKGKSASIRRVLEESDILRHATYVAFIDADTHADNNYFTAVASRFLAEPDIAVICGVTKSIPKNRLTAWRAFTYFTSHAIYKNAQSAMGIIMVCPGCCTTWRADVLKAVRWDGDTLAEDMDATVQTYRNNLGRAVFESTAIVHAQDPETLGGYCRQMMRWHVGAWQVMRKHHMLFRATWLDMELGFLMGEGLAVAALLCALPFIAFTAPRIACIAYGTELTAIFALAALAAWRERRADILRASWMFPLMRMLDAAILLASFMRAVIVRTPHVRWFGVHRYR